MESDQVALERGRLDVVIAELLFMALRCGGERRGKTNPEGEAGRAVREGTVSPARPGR